jgi:phage tail sheath protein FI
VQEVPSGVRTIVGVATSIGLFIGRATRGPIFRPILCTSYADFTRAFSEDPIAGELPFAVRLFFLNGGTQCWVMRIASGAGPSKVDLQNENGAAVLRLTAKSAGVDGENIRAVVSYGGAQPDVTFNIDLFRWEVQNGQRVQKDLESWKNLSMDPALPSYAPTFLTQNSGLVDAADRDPGFALAAPGFSQSGRPIVVNAPAASADFGNAWRPIVGTAGPAARQRFLLSVDGGPFLPLDLSAINFAAFNPLAIQADLENAIKGAVTTQFAAQGFPGVNVAVSFVAGPNPGGGNTTTMLRITSTANHDVFVRPAPTQDASVSLMLGAEQGGLEVGAHANRRPAPNGISFRATNPANLVSFAQLLQNRITSITLEALGPGGVLAPNTIALNLVTTVPADRIYVDSLAASLTGNSAGVREKFAAIAAAINQERQNNPNSPWTASVAGYRLTIVPQGGGGDNLLSSATAPGALVNDLWNVVPGTMFTSNVKFYTLGAGGLGVGRQTAVATGSDGNAPLAPDYAAAYDIVDREIDLFNLLILPPNASSLITPQSLYGVASTFCQRRRAFLVMDPPDQWSDVQDVINAATGVNSLRLGLVKDFAALYFPRVVLDDRGTRVPVGPAGAVAGVMARTDATRGVWKAPAGTEADLRGVVGLEHRISDPENGVINPHAVNALRIFPSGITVWGARTMDGDDGFASEYKYVPIRRLALYMEESLYRGLKWAVFEPNDEPLWAQIRLNVGAFMHNLFRQGAFQGTTPRDAYFVKCDKETTTQNDRNLGIVNIWVGFAPLKPAEFVILYLQQMAGQIEV